MGIRRLYNWINQLSNTTIWWCVYGWVRSTKCTTYQPDLTTFLQPRHIPTQSYNITQSSSPYDGHMVARNMLSNY